MSFNLWASKKSVTTPLVMTGQASDTTLFGLVNTLFVGRFAAPQLRESVTVRPSSHSYMGVTWGNVYKFSGVWCSDPLV